MRYETCFMCAKGVFVAYRTVGSRVMYSQSFGLTFTTSRQDSTKMVFQSLRLHADGSIKHLRAFQLGRTIEEGKQAWHQLHLRSHLASHLPSLPGSPSPPHQQDYRAQASPTTKHHHQLTPLPPSSTTAAKKLSCTTSSRTPPTPSCATTPR